MLFFVSSVEKLKNIPEQRTRHGSSSACRLAQLMVRGNTTAEPHMGAVYTCPCQCVNRTMLFVCMCVSWCVCSHAVVCCLCVQCWEDTVTSCRQQLQITVHTACTTHNIVHSLSNASRPLSTYMHTMKSHLMIPAIPLGSAAEGKNHAHTHGLLVISSFTIVSSYL